MRKTTLLALAIVSIQFVFSQETTPKKSLSAKGNKYWGIGISPVYSDAFLSYTDFGFQNGNSNIGLLAMSHYGKFVADNVMVGGVLTTGYHYNKSSFTNSFPGGIFPGVPNPSKIEYTNKYNDFDISIAPFARYYINFNKRGSVALFLQGAIPYVYSTSVFKGEQLNNGVLSSNGYTTTYSSLRGSLGFGVAVQAKFGSVDTHVSNMGWFISFNKLIKK
ncbi:MAG: hypothetical protein RL596_131 [Bacteroidota bacterium]|jgi:hypothetical protein